MIMSQTALRGVQVPSLRNLRVLASPAPEIEWIGEYEVKVTATGVRCGNHGRTAPSEHVHHANPASVRECYRLAAQMEADQAAEIAAELAYERHLEDRGYWDARAQEDWEERHGVIQFEDAYRAACPELFE
jgi:hypothetical protein